MNRCFAILAVLAVVAAFASPVQAQQAAAYTNPLDDSGDVQNWYLYDYYGYWAVDSSPIAGHDGGGSLNCNDGTGLDYLGYNYMEMQSSPIDISGLQDPILTWWCIMDIPDPNQNYMDAYLNLYDGNYNEYAGFSMGLWGWEDLACDDDWHQHSVPIPNNIQGSVIFAPYMYFEDYYYNPGNQGWFIDEMQILVPDITPPDPISDLAAANATLTEIELSWTSPNDDDISGETASFELRFSTSAITETNFGSATEVTGEPAPGANGSSHNVLITGLTEDTTYFFAIRTTDIAGNVSEISNVATLATLAPPPPPPAPGPIQTVEEIKVKDDILPCSAGTSAAPMGLAALAGLIVLGFVLRRKA